MRTGSQVLNGLERITRNQREGAHKTRSDPIALQALQDASPPHQTKIGEIGIKRFEKRAFSKTTGA
jgi:hypothetical protein